MLRACALDYGSSWDDNLPYAEFSYNNCYQASIGMAPLEALYGKKCTTPLLWSGLGEINLFGPDIIQEAEEKVRLFKYRLKIAQSRRKAMRIRSVVMCPMRQEIEFISEYHLCVESRGLESKGSWLQDS